MDVSNKKKVNIIIFLILTVMIIILIVSINYLTKTDRFGYKLPDSVKNKSTIVTVDKSYLNLTDNEKIKYNEELLKNNFLLPLNNSIKDSLNIYNINLIQNDESKFKFAYTKLMLENNLNIDLNKINEEVQNIFNYQITDNYISKYYNGKDYYYNYDKDYTFCLKATAKKEDKNYLFLKFDLLDYNDELCNTNTFNYKTSREGILSYNIQNGKYHIDSLKIIKKKG